MKGIRQRINKYSANSKYTKQLIEGILTSVEKLVKFPKLGQEEQQLCDEPQGFRYVIYKQYKIIYWLNESKHRIKVRDIFDKRQNPRKMAEFK